MALNSRRAAAENWESQIRKGWLELAILANLWEETLSGLDILRRLQSQSDLLLAEGTIYPILSRLKRDGLVDSNWVESDSGHPRKYYRLSKTGRRRATEMVQAWDEFSAAMRQLTELTKETAND